MLIQLGLDEPVTKPHKIVTDMLLAIHQQGYT